MTGPPCDLVGADVVPRYVAGTLEPDAVEPFELHMVDCATCQRAIREAAALRKVLRKVQDKVQGTTEIARAMPRPMRRRLKWVVPLAAAAAVTAIWLGRPSDAPFERLGRLAGAPALDVLPVRRDRPQCRYHRGVIPLANTIEVYSISFRELASHNRQR